MQNTKNTKATYTKEDLNYALQFYWLSNASDLQDLFNLTDEQMDIIARNDREFNKLECEEEGVTKEQEQAMHDFAESVIDELDISFE